MGQFLNVSGERTSEKTFIEHYHRQSQLIGVDK